MRSLLGRHFVGTAAPLGATTAYRTAVGERRTRSLESATTNARLDQTRELIERSRSGAHVVDGATSTGSASCEATSSVVPCSVSGSNRDGYFAAQRRLRGLDWSTSNKHLVGYALDASGVGTSETPMHELLLEQMLGIVDASRSSSRICRRSALSGRRSGTDARRAVAARFPPLNCARGSLDVAQFDKPRPFMREQVAAQKCRARVHVSGTYRQHRCSLHQ